MSYMRQAVATIEEPNGHLRYVPLSVYLDKFTSIADIEDIVEMAVRNARIEAGKGTVINIEWMGEEEL